MTAGERNCYIAIGELLDCYKIEDVQFALREQCRERGIKRGGRRRQSAAETPRPADQR